MDKTQFILQIASGVLDVVMCLLCVPIAACCWSVSLMFLSAFSASDRFFTVRGKRRRIRAKGGNKRSNKKDEDREEKNIECDEPAPAVCVCWRVASSHLQASL